MNAHQEPPYRDANWSLQNSEQFRDQVILLPLFSRMGMDNLRYISDTIHEAMGFIG
jgi:dTDP-4-amino-4,6-dideoxygalactose transaminase